MFKKLNYWRRILKVYTLNSQSYLNFWHEKPAINENFKKDELDAYYMTFEDKAYYSGPKDKNGVILLDYYGDIGRQYNPVAIAQYGLGNFNLYLKTKEKKYLDIARKQGDWLVKNLEKNKFGLKVWMHHFNWTYKKILKAPWYSALSQGSGISLLVRLYKETNKGEYLNKAKEALESMFVEIKDGGVKYIDKKGNVWLEEYILYPDSPTHILNGFIWALWGIWDYYLITKDERALKLFNSCVKTLKENLSRYDIGFWSLYDLSRQLLKTIASFFYHNLHIVQLKIMFKLTKEPIFEFYAKKWQKYKGNKLYRNIALIYKAIFKIIYF